MSQELFVKYWDTGLKVLTTVALLAVALLGTKFVTKEEFTAANSRIEKIEAVLIRMEQNAVTDARHDNILNDHENRIRTLERK
jgi:LPS O-antigen subunit length determinant protein (WzzB/FepE family)